jgi:predicted esterase YcpF (UPF0227 family)
MTKYIYIHGLNSSKNSYKYKILNQRFDMIILEWDKLTNINSKIDEIIKNINPSDKLMLIGDSTGGNFACQLRDKLNILNIYSKLVLLNPLLNIESLIIDIMPNEILKYIKPINEIKDALLIISNNDEVVNNKDLNSFEETTNIVRVNDTHKLENIEEYIYLISDYSEKIVL